jgi:hypothetical protein
LIGSFMAADAQEPHQGGHERLAPPRWRLSATVDRGKPATAWPSAPSEDAGTLDCPGWPFTVIELWIHPFARVDTNKCGLWNSPGLTRLAAPAQNTSIVKNGIRGVGRLDPRVAASDEIRCWLQASREGNRRFAPPVDSLF